MTGDTYFFPLSFAQQRLWFLDELVPGSSFYNLASAIPLSFPIKHEALQSGLNAVVARHESLRTTFVSVDGRPRQRVADELRISMDFTDLSELGREESRRKSEQVATEEAQCPFDIERGPLIRSKLLKRGSNDYLFLLTVHHIVCDGWSMGILWKELNEFYTAHLLGREAQLPPLEIQYPDFAVWQNEWLGGPMLVEQLAYWKQQLRNVPNLELPTDRPRPALATYRGGQHALALPATVSSALRQLCRRLGLTTFMLTLTAFQVLLQRYTRQTDIVIGVPTAGRNRRELEGLIGFFVNTLVMRADLSGNPSFEELAARTREMALNAYAHQDLPFEKLVEELQPDRDLSRNPLFQVTFQLFSDFNSGSSSPSDSGASPLSQKGTAVFDLSMNLWDRASGIAGYVEYSSDLFDEQTIANLCANYVTLLERIIDAPATPILDLPILRPEEERLLREWNQTDVHYDTGITLHAIFEERARTNPERLAVQCGASTVTYGELNRRADRLARRLLASGLAPGTPAALCMPRSIDFVVAELAILKAGGAFVPLDPTHPDERLRQLLQQVENPCLLTLSRDIARFENMASVLIAVDDEWADAASVELTPDTAASACDLAYIIFTSGSTGWPKGVEVKHRSAVNLVAWHCRAYDVTAEDRASHVASPAFDAAVWEIWPHLASGASVHVAPDDVCVDPTRTFAWLAENDISIAFLPTPVAERALVEKLPPNLALRTLLVGGDRLHRSPPAGLGFRVHNNYGPTECTVVATAAVLEPGDERSPPIGRPIDNVRAYVLDETQSRVPIGVWGELYVAGAGVSRGYRGDREQSDARFVEIRPGGQLERCYRTGDIVRFRADGQLEFLRRDDKQVQVRAHRVELGEIERILSDHPEIAEALVVARQLPAGVDGDIQLVAYVVPKPDATPASSGDEEAVTAQEPSRQRRVRDYLSSRLPGYAVPARLVELGSLPLTASGKVDVAALPDPGHEVRSGAHREPEDELQATIAEIFSELLAVRDPGVDDNFFADLGGHSLLATQVLSRVQAQFDVAVPLRELFAAPTIAGLAASVETALIAQIEGLSDDEAERLLAQA